MILLFVLSILNCALIIAFLPPHLLLHFSTKCQWLQSSQAQDPLSSSLLLKTSITDDNLVRFDSLDDMDVVVFSNKEEKDERMFLGAVYDGILSPLSAWTNEPAFGDSIELLVDEKDRFSLTKENENNENPLFTNVRIHYHLQETELSYGSRQCQRGIENPHGEESELLYYVDQQLIDKFGIKMIIKPELEILW